MHSCSSKAIYPFHLPSLLKRRFFLSCHRQHPAFCQGCRGEAPGWLLSPVTFISCQFWFSLWRAACANTIWSIAEGGIWIHAMLYIQYIPIECMCLFVKAAVLNLFWSIFVPAVLPYTSLHYGTHWLNDTLWHSLDATIGSLAQVHTCQTGDPHQSLMLLWTAGIRTLFGSINIFSFLHSIPCAKKQQMRRIITPAKVIHSMHVICPD